MVVVQGEALAMALGIAEAIRRWRLERHGQRTAPLQCPVPRPLGKWSIDRVSPHALLRKPRTFGHLSLSPGRHHRDYSERDPALLKQDFLDRSCRRQRSPEALATSG